MKKALLTGFVILQSLAVFAQNDAVTNAFFDQKNGDLAKAKSEIDRASLHEKTKDNAKTWFFKGSIYSDIAVTDKKEYQTLSPDPLREAYEAYKKTIALDKKGGEYAKSAEKNIEQLWGISFNDGVKKYQEKEYDKALRAYDLSNEIKSGDTLTLLYIAYAAEASQKYERIKTTYQELFKYNRRTPDMYRTLSSFEQKDNKMDAALSIIQEGRKYFPTDKALAIDELALLSQTGALDQSVTKIEDAIKLDPKNGSLYVTLASIYDKQSQDTKKTPEQRAGLRQKAMANYVKTLEIDSTNSDASFNIGVSHFNEGVTISKKVNEMSLNDYNKFGKKLEAQAKEHYAKALPYFKRCFKLVPTDKLVQQSLKSTYIALGRKAEAEAIKD
jgi:tetratricopeptide (TPR) repeat protein